VSKTKLPNELLKMGSNIRRIRTSLEMSQERLAELADVNARTVRRIEAGEINILITTIVRIRKALGCKWDDLMPPEWNP
jgi:transcriptional regulator with XRE-family HTH domain